MPTDSTDALIERPKTFEDLLARPDFRRSLDQRSHELERVLSNYHFAAKVPCGLSSCHTPHQTGFLVRTKAGLETAIGHVCGRKIFGEEVWELAAAKYARESRRRDLLARAQEIQSSAPAISRAIAEAMSDRFGVRWVRDVRSAISSVIGDELCQSLSAGRKRGAVPVTQVRERSAAEMDRLAVAQKRHRDAFRTETVTIGHLRSAAWLTFEFSKVLREEIQAPLDDFAQVNPVDLPTPVLGRKLKQFDGWEKKIQDALAAAKTAVDFLEADNLDLLVLWIPERMSARRQALKQWAVSDARATLQKGLTGKDVSGAEQP